VKIKSIHLDDEGKPKDLAATMTVSEAAFLCRLTGSLSETQAGGYGVTETYFELAELFNRFYEGGVRDIANYPLPGEST
jgi:hypothetical protein